MVYYLMASWKAGFGWTGGGGGEGVSSTSIDRSRDKTSNTFIGSLASDCGLPQQGPEHESGLCCETHSCSS